MIRLEGITWDHSRGYLPMVATAQRFLELHGVEISWRKRSLQEFADYPLQKLTATFDLLVIDHPFVGYAASHPVLLPLDDYLPADYLRDQAENSVGASHRSYQYGGHQWALATDAATPVASYRPDLLKRHGLNLPETWDDLLELAGSGLVILPAIPVDSLMNLYYLCVTQGSALFQEGKLMDEDIGVQALEQLRTLVDLCPAECLERNPIKTYDALAAGDHHLYCPFAYGYTNYARRGYAEHLLRFTDVISFTDDQPARTTLGGTGLAISSGCRHKEVAAEYLRYVNSALIQRTLYLDSGGQPGHRSAWLDADNNARTNDFFKDTLATHDNAYLRPRYDGYLFFQDRAGPLVHHYLRYGGAPKKVLAQLQDLYEASWQGSDALEEQA